MKANTLYERLESDFITPEMTDDWTNSMSEVEEFLSDNFKRRSIGVVCDFSDEIHKVYTAVFPSNEVMNRILDDDAQNALLFLHHPAIWDIRNAPNVFYQMDTELLAQFKERKISIYNLHTPLDHFGEYSTSVTLARAIGITIDKAFGPYNGALAGVLGNTTCSIEELKKTFEKAVGHHVKAYNYGNDEITGVGVIGGGGNNSKFLEELVAARANVMVTGITAQSPHSQSAHDFAKEHGISLLGGTHYSTEKFACIAMCEYFEKLGLDAEFIPEEPLFEDL